MPDTKTWWWRNNVASDRSQKDFSHMTFFLESESSSSSPHGRIAKYIAESTFFLIFVSMKEKEAHDHELVPPSWLPGNHSAKGRLDRVPRSVLSNDERMHLSERSPCMTRCYASSFLVTAAWRPKGHSIVASSRVDTSRQSFTSPLSVRTAWSCLNSTGRNGECAPVLSVKSTC